MSRSRWIKGFLVLFLFASAPAWTAASPGPLEVVQSGTDRILEILSAPDHQDALGTPQCRARIMDILNRSFSFPEMARSLLADRWNDQLPEKREEFVEIFQELILNAYVNRVAKCCCSKGRFFYDREEIAGDQALVRTRMVDSKKDEVPISYRLRLENGSWRVCDVVVRGISLIGQYRSQVQSLLARQSFDTLLGLLRAKACMY